MLIFITVFKVVINSKYHHYEIVVVTVKHSIIVFKEIKLPCKREINLNRVKHLIGVNFSGP